jgi:predicted amidohydrolase
LIVCPALFFADVPTDIQFWEWLLCGRAIDTACYLVSATICGSTSPIYSSGMPSPDPVWFHGVTRLVDPLGTILARGSEDHPDLIQGKVTRARLDVARENFPVGPP